LKRKPKDEARRARNDLYRRHILEAAERVFADRGFEPAKVQEISELAELSMGTIYSIFGGKEEIFAAILEERGRELLEIARTTATSAASAREALDRLVERYLGYFADHPTFLQMHLKLGHSWVLEPGGEANGQVKLWQEIHGHQTEIFRRGVADKTFVEEDPAYLAKLFSAMDQVVLAEWVASGMKADRAALVERLRRACERAFYRTRPAAR
jgi:AcrR family transcriptional regulator